MIAIRSRVVGRSSGIGLFMVTAKVVFYKFLLPIYRFITALLHRGSVPRVLTELETQFPRGPEESHLDRPFRGIENLAHASQLKALKMLQVKHHALARRKSFRARRMCALNSCLIVVARGYCLVCRPTVGPASRHR